MICYMAKKSDGELRINFISETWFNITVPGWSMVPVEVRELDEKRKRLEDAAGDLLAALKKIYDLRTYEYEPIEAFGEAWEIAEAAIAKAEGKQ